MKKTLLISSLFLFISCHVNSNLNTDIDSSLIVAEKKSSNITTTELKNYVYPFYLDSTQQIRLPVSCFFIKHDNQSYFVTARHVFFDPYTNKRRQFLGITIYTNPDSLNLPGLQILEKDLKLFPECSDMTCLDFIISLVKIPPNIRVNYIDISRKHQPSDTVPGNAVFIPGYPHDYYKLISTSLVDWRDNFPTFLTKDPSDFSASGSPVFMYSKKEMFLIGIYDGRRTDTNYGFATKSEILKLVMDDLPK